jgi:hypothetical protein
MSKYMADKHNVADKQESCVLLLLLPFYLHTQNVSAAMLLLNLMPSPTTQTGACAV